MSVCLGIGFRWARVSSPRRLGLSLIPKAADWGQVRPTNSRWVGRGVSAEPASDIAESAHRGCHATYLREGSVDPGMNRHAGDGAHLACLPSAARQSNVQYSMNRRFRLIGASLLSLLTGMAFLRAQPAREIPRAYGPHVNLAEEDFAESRTFTATNRIVGTYYFYWYDCYSQAHVIDGDGTDALTTHPPTLEDFSYKSARWHRRQLEDMMAAGIDVVLPVFWGSPAEHDEKTGLHWSFAGLPPLVQARAELLKEGKSPPRIGLFYDTSTLQHNAWGRRIDLTTDFGRRWFYATIRDFFSLIPAKHWAMIDGKPIVLLYSASFASKHDQSCIDFVKQEFPKEFGGRVPWIAREVSWQVKSDSTVAWGGALGLKNPGVASLGPGYDHSAVPGREPLVVDRKGGAFYEENWLKFLRRPSNFVMVETWNEFHEGTDVAESKEYGRRFIELTRQYVDRFKSGWQPPKVKGAFTDARSVSVVLGAKNRESGLRLVDVEDGLHDPTTVGGREGRASLAAPGKGRYLYFVVDESFKWADPMSATLEVDYFDAAAGTLGVEFDGSDESAPFSGAYTRCRELVKLEGSRSWRTARFRLEGARFLNSQNVGADLRLVIAAPGFVVSEARLTRS